MGENPEVTQSPVQPEAPVAPEAPTTEAEAPESTPAPEAPVEEAPAEPESQPEEEAVAPVDEDRSAYNCRACGGEGLKDQVTVCPDCRGTGKVA